MRTELVKKRNVDEETNAESCTPSRIRRKNNTWQDNISHKIGVSNQLDADFNFPKIDLMSLWVKQIRRYRTLQQYSAVGHEQAHKLNLKDGWNASSATCKILWKSPLNNSATFNSHTDPSRCSQLLPDRLSAKQ